MSEMIKSEEKNITDSILAKVNELQEASVIKMPEGYNVGNALKSAWLKLQTVKDKDKKVAGAVCTPTSISNALFDMCIQGLSPAKNQCYFVIRGNELQLMRSYFGTIAVMKRLKGVSDVFAQVVYKDDVFEYQIDGGNIVITKHEQKLENIDMDKIIGAYCVIVKDGTPRAELMTMAQIRKAWSHTSSGGSVQKEYPDQMAKRTVINRGAKWYVNTASDADELIEAINRSSENEYDNSEPDEIEENGEAIVIPESDIRIEDTEPEKAQPAPVPEKPKAQTRKGPGF